MQGNIVPIAEGNMLFREGTEVPGQYKPAEIRRTCVGINLESIGLQC